MVAITQTFALVIAAASGMQMVMATPSAPENALAADHTSSAPANHVRVKASKSSSKTHRPTPTGSAPDGGSGSGDFGITCDKLNKAVSAGGKAVANSYPAPSAAQCKAFLTGLKKSGITSAREAAMFLTNIAWESDGLRAKEEYLCKQTPSACYSAYGPGNGKGQYFWGRGYIQLSWGDNYKAASQAIFHDDRLYQNPAQVATNEQIAWDVSYWFWRVNVHPDAGVQAGKFGASVNKINGALECKGANKAAARKRYAMYKAILPIFAPGVKAIESGCYN